MTRALIAASFVGCAGTPATGPFLRLRGEVTPEVTLRDEPVAVIVWVTAAEGELCVETVEPRFEPSLFVYEVEIDGPPALNGDPCVPWPAEVAPRAPFGLGVLVLADVRDPAFTVTADPTTLFGWVTAGDPPLDDALLARGARVAAAADGFLLGVAGEGGTFPPALCRLDDLLPGLTLYADRGVGCAGWQPQGAAGARTEFQGVNFTPLSD